MKCQTTSITKNNKGDIHMETITESKNKNCIDYKEKFKIVFNSLSSKYDKYTVWKDYVEMHAIHLSNACDKRFEIEREKRQMEIRKKYSNMEYNNFMEMFSSTAKALDKNREQDFLGMLYVELGLCDEAELVRFFPYDTAKSQANTSYAEGKKAENQCLVSITDSCCGSGCMLIAYANILEKDNINYQQKVMFYAQDIDKTAALMCYIQLALLGIRAVIKIGNPLTDPFEKGEEFTKENHWITPMCYAEPINTSKLLPVNGLLRLMVLSKLQELFEEVLKEIPAKQNK